MIDYQTIVISHLYDKLLDAHLSDSWSDSTIPEFWGHRITSNMFISKFPRTTHLFGAPFSTYAAVRMASRRLATKGRETLLRWRSHAEMDQNTSKPQRKHFETSKYPCDSGKNTWTPTNSTWLPWKSLPSRCPSDIWGASRGPGSLVTWESNGSHVKITGIAWLKTVNCFSSLRMGFTPTII